MNDEARADELIDTALDTLPLAPLPPMFVDGVLTQIKASTRPVTVEPFRLEPVDFLVPAFMTLFAVVTLLIFGRSGDGVALESLFASLLVSPWLLTVILVVAVELGLGAVFCLWLWGDRPFST